MNIKFKGSLTKEEFKNAVKLMNHPISKKAGINIDAWIMLTIIGAVLIIFGIRTLFVEQNISAGSVFATIGAVVFSYGLRVRTAIDKAWDENQKSNSNFSGTVTNEYLEVQNSEGMSQILWTAFDGYGKNNNVILLLRGNTGHFFSQSLFQNDEDWHKFSDFIASKLKMTHKVEKKILSTKNILVIGWIILSAILVILVLSRTGAK